jgi:hypothetical protein
MNGSEMKGNEKFITRLPFVLFSLVMKIYSNKNLSSRRLNGPESPFKSVQRADGGKKCESKEVEEE